MITWMVKRGLLPWTMKWWIEVWIGAFSTYVVKWWIESWRQSQSIVYSTLSRNFSIPLRERKPCLINPIKNRFSYTLVAVPKNRLARALYQRECVLLKILLRTAFVYKIGSERGCVILDLPENSWNLPNGVMRSRTYRRRDITAGYWSYPQV